MTIALPGKPEPPDFSVEGYLRPLAHQVPTSLVSAAAFARASELAAHLPGGVTSFLGFECPLGQDAANADFLFCSTEPEGHVRVLAGLDPVADFPGALLNSDSWQRVHAFCRDWVEPTTGIGSRLQNIWLEFDLARNPEALHFPSLFFGPVPPMAGAPAIDNESDVRAVLARVEPAALEGARGQHLRRLYAALPVGAYVFQVGLMWGRDTTATRLCLRGLGPERIAPLLIALGWPADDDPLGALIAEMSGIALRLDLDLDVGTALGSRIGIECYFGRDRLTTARLGQACELLIARGLCTRAEAEGLLCYSGLSHQDTAAAQWPSALRAAASAVDPGCRSCLLRWVHHLKIVIEPGRSYGAKAYLAIEHHLLDDRRLRQAIRAARHEQ